MNIRRKQSVMKPTVDDAPIINDALPGGLTVLGRTPEQSGGEIVLRIKGNGKTRDKHYAVSTLLKETGVLATDLAEAGYIVHARGIYLRRVADKILAQGLAKKTVVLAATGLTKLEFGSEATWIYVWNGRAYTFGPNPPMKVVVPRGVSKVRFAGTLEGWKQSVGDRLRGNPYLLVVVSHALAAALRRVFQQGYLVLLLVGPSSSGKTTAQRTAASMLGSPDNEVGVLQMGGTEVGVRQQFGGHPDLPVCFQDVRQFTSVEAFFRLIFSAADGAAYYKHDAIPRPLAATPIISNERSLLDMSYRGNVGLDEGIFARCFEIIANAPHGFFHDLHEANGPKQFADDLKAATQRCHGWIWPAWLQCLADNWPRVLDWHERLLPRVRKKIAGRVAMDQISQVDARMLDGLVFSAWVGLVAVKLGILPVKFSEILESFERVFAEHMGRRSVGTTPVSERVVAQVRAYIDEHQARFPSLELFDATTLPNAIGYRHEAKNVGELFLFYPERFNECFVAEHGSIVFNILHHAGFLHVTAGRGNQFQVRIPGHADSNKRKSFIAIKSMIRYDQD